MKWRSLLVVLASVILSSCVAIVVAGAAAGMIVFDKRSVAVMERDARIYHIVHTTLIKDPRFSDSRIEVVSFNQVVLLVGEAPTASLKREAERVARSTPGVRRVYDEITVGYPVSMSTITKDSMITGHVRTHMLHRKGLESGSIRIVTVDRVVYLMGIATQEQANLAVDVARHVRGVRKVVKVFQYII
jgi:osmotically-inducible protein OsmY